MKSQKQKRIRWKTKQTRNWCLQKQIIFDKKQPNVLDYVVWLSSRIVNFNNQVNVNSNWQIKNILFDNLLGVTFYFSELYQYSQLHTSQCIYFPNATFVNLSIQVYPSFFYISLCSIFPSIHWLLSLLFFYLSMPIFPHIVIHTISNKYSLVADLPLFNKYVVFSLYLFFSLICI